MRANTGVTIIGAAKGLLLSQKVALIPGGIKGIGREVAFRLVDNGWAVALCYRTSHEVAERTRQELDARGARSLIAVCDVSNPDNCKSLVDNVLAWGGGRIDALIHCAGPYHRVDVLEETPEGWREMIGGNLDSLFYMARLVAPGMIQRRWGRIVAFSMANADRVLAQVDLTGHHIGKVGVLGLVRGLAKRLARDNVTVNAVSPGFVDSGSMPPDELNKLTKMIPAGRVGTVNDAANAVMFLLSEEASYVNGTSLLVNGAWGL